MDGAICQSLIFFVLGVFGRPCVKRFALCYRTVVGLSVYPVLSVTFVHCGQTVGWITISHGP